MKRFLTTEDESMSMHPLKGNPIFPLKIRPKDGWQAPGDRKVRSKSFGSSRDKGEKKRTHAGCDLYVPPNTTVHAVADGWIHEVGYNAFFLSETIRALQVNHDGFTVIYGEVVPDSELLRRMNKIPVEGPVSVRQNDMIAKVAYQGEDTQLHFELYLNLADTKSRVLLDKGKTNAPYERNFPPEDPTPYLVQWLAKLSEPPVSRPADWSCVRERR